MNLRAPLRAARASLVTRWSGSFGEEALTLKSFDVAGDRCVGTEPNTVRLSVAGALLRVSHGNPELFGLLWAELERIATPAWADSSGRAGVIPAGDTFEQWLASPVRSESDVLAVFDKAISRNKGAPHG